MINHILEGMFTTLFKKWKVNCIRNTLVVTYVNDVRSVQWHGDDTADVHTYYELTPFLFLLRHSWDEHTKGKCADLASGEENPVHCSMTVIFFLAHGAGKNQKNVFSSPIVYNRNIEGGKELVYNWPKLEIIIITINFPKLPTLVIWGKNLTNL